MISSWLTKCPELIHKIFSKEFIIESIQIILENENVYFNDIMYTLVQGTVMGTQFVHTYATLVLAYLEKYGKHGLNVWKYNFICK